MRSLTALPQLAELIDPPPVQRDQLMPAREAVPPPPRAEEIEGHVARCDELIGAIERRLGLEGQANVLSTLGAAGGAIEQLHLRVLYLRRIHHFDYLGGGQFASHAALLSACGEGHFANRCVVHAASREPLAAPIVYAKGPGVAEVRIRLLLIAHD